MTGGASAYDGEMAVGAVHDAHLPSPATSETLSDDRCTRLALSALDEALADAGLRPGSVEPERVGIVFASALAGLTTQEQAFARFYGDGVKRVAPNSFLAGMSAIALHVLARRAGAKGPSMIAAGACAASAHAIWAALQWLRAGAADVVIVVAAETPLTPVHLAAWRSLRVLSPDRCRPFSRERRGTSLGEGAAAMVLVRASSYSANGRSAYCACAGAGLATDTRQALHPDADSVVAVIRAALRDAGVSAKSVSYVNAHATGTVVGDRVEAEALQRVFGQGGGRPVVSSTKGVHGHLLGAAALVEGVITAYAIHKAAAPPSTLATPVDPSCGVHILETPLTSAIDAALSNSLAFGGLLASIVFRKCET